MVLRNPATGGTCNIPWRGKIKPPFEMGVSDLEMIDKMSSTNSCYEQNG